LEKLLIDGQFVEPVRGETYEVRNPADIREIVGIAAKATTEDARKAVDSSSEAFEKWSMMSPATRAKILLKVASLIDNDEQLIARMITKENGKPIADALGEVRGFVGHLEFYAGLWPSLRGSYVPISDPLKFAVVMKKPVGVCVAIIPWNNPIIQLAQKLPPALIAGNTMIVKPATTTPISVMHVGELFLRAGLQAGVLNIVTGPGDILGPELVRNTKVSKVSFTGDTATGKKVMALASEGIKKVTLELGGNDPMIVCEDADLKLAIDGAIFGRFRNTGQGCLCVKRLYLVEEIASKFISEMTGKTRRLRVGDGIKADTQIGPCHTAHQRDIVESQVADAIQRGAKIATGGKRPVGKEHMHGHFYLPTLLTEVDSESRIAKEECFGPALPIFVVKDLEEGIERANDSIFGLGSYVFTNYINRAITRGEKTRAGKTLINTAYDVSVELPHGGTKQTGIGRENGIEVFDYYTEPKVLMIDTSTSRKMWDTD